MLLRDSLRESEGPPPPPRPWDMGAVCEALLDHCLDLGSRDNMSVAIVLLKPSLKPTASPAAKLLKAVKRWLGLD